MGRRPGKVAMHTTAAAIFIFIYRGVVTKSESGHVPPAPPPTVRTCPFRIRIDSNEGITAVQTVLLRYTDMLDFLQSQLIFFV